MAKQPVNLSVSPLDESHDLLPYLKDHGAGIRMQQILNRDALNSTGWILKLYTFSEKYYGLNLYVTKDTYAKVTKDNLVVPVLEVMVEWAADALEWYAHWLSERYLYALDLSLERILHPEKEEPIIYIPHLYFNKKNEENTAWLKEKTL